MDNLLKQIVEGLNCFENHHQYHRTKLSYNNERESGRIKKENDMIRSVEVP